MSEEGGAPATGVHEAAAPVPAAHQSPTPGHHPNGINTSMARLAKEESPLSPRIATPNPFSRKNTSLDLDDYFRGPRDIAKHSKWPMFMRMHGSILPKMILPLLAVGVWSTTITLIYHYTGRLNVNSILLTVTGFVVGLGLSFRSSTAYERYNEGRKYWAQLVLASQTLGRVFWVHAKEREGELAEKDLLAKLTAMNLLVAFAVSLKHKLRFEPYASYNDLQHLVSHLDTLSNAATCDVPESAITRSKPGFFKSMGEYLGVSFATSNPRKIIKKSPRPLGNTPLEILSYLGSFTDELVANGQLTVAMHMTLAYNNIASLNDVLTGTERVLNTPLPIAYGIAIAQITWLYVFLLPFQLVAPLKFVTIPASMGAAFIILGLLFIGKEIENPFGEDVNDLPLESYCAQIAAELDIIAAKPKPRSQDWIESVDNRVLWPLSNNGYHAWANRGESRIREALKAKTELGYAARKEMEAAHGEDEKSNGRHTVDVV